MPEKVEAIRDCISKAEMGALIVQGYTHIHSSPNIKGDRFANIVDSALEKGRTPIFPWELIRLASVIEVTSSIQREKTISTIITALQLDNKPTLKGRVTSVLEELLTNAFYHAYHLSNGKEKYERTKVANLETAEAIRIQFGVKKGGVFLSVEDKAGTFSFKHLQNALKRCYSKTCPEQLESKAGGAGLGLYLIFEETTHLKIVSIPGKSTRFCCWIKDPARSKSQIYSFNCFSEEEK